MVKEEILEVRGEREVKMEGRRRVKGDDEEER